MPNINRTVYAYWYKGKPLYHWCKEKGIRYTSVMTSIYKGLNIEQAAEHHLQNKYKQTRNNLKYLIDGTPIRKILSKYWYNRFTFKIYRLNKKSVVYDWKEIYSKILEEMKK